MEQIGVWIDGTRARSHTGLYQKYPHWLRLDDRQMELCQLQWEVRGFAAAPRYSAVVTCLCDPLPVVSQ